MPVKDSLARWLIKNVIIPRQEVMDKPGFIVCQYADKGEKVYLRELIYPESLYADFEKKLVNQYGDAGRKVLYSAGKKFGMLYCSVSNFPTLKNSKEGHIEKFIYDFVRYAECTWAKRIDYSIDITHKRAELHIDNCIICRLSGVGHIWTEGSIIGLWAHTLNDSRIEGVQLTCQGRGDKICTVISAPPELLEKEKLHFFRETDLHDLALGPDYQQINALRQTKFATKSFKDLLNAGFLKYSGGTISHNAERHFYCDASMYYMIERELKKLPNADNLLFDSAFEFGKRLTQKEEIREVTKFITDYMSAMGWGDVLVTKERGKYKVVSRYAPWTKYYDEIDFVAYRGMISGMLSSSLGHEIRLSKTVRDLSGGFFTLTVSE